MSTPFISEFKYLGGGNQDFVEVMVPTGFSTAGLVVTVYNPDGTVRSSDALGTSVGSDSGYDIYVIDSSYPGFDGLHQNGSISISSGTTVYQYAEFGGNNATTPATEGPAAGLTPTNVGSTVGGQSLSGNPIDGYTAGAPTEGSIDSSNIPCFVAGTLIQTPHGFEPIERLIAGDEIVTLDNGVQRIRWIGSTETNGDANFAPIMIKANTFRNRSDLLVSPQHRVLVTNWRAPILFGTSEVITTAKSLIDGAHIFFAPRPRVQYFHMLFDLHELINSNGAWTESFFPGEHVIGDMDTATREEVFSLFPHIRADLSTYGPPARRSLLSAEARLLN